MKMNKSHWKNLEMGDTILLQAAIPQTIAFSLNSSNKDCRGGRKFHQIRGRHIAHV